MMAMANRKFWKLWKVWKYNASAPITRLSPMPNCPREKTLIPMKSMNANKKT